MTTTRAQRSRRRGWTAPEGSVYVGRPTRWGNPYSAKKLGQQQAVAWFRLTVQAMDADARRAWLAPLRDKVLLCWCREGEACHVDVLIEYLGEDR